MKKSDLDLGRIIMEEVSAHLKKLLAKRDARLDALEKRLATFETKAEGRERQLDRHAEHLRRIETRTAALERKA